MEVGLKDDIGFKDRGMWANTLSPATFRFEQTIVNSMPPLSLLREIRRKGRL